MTTATGTPVTAKDVPTLRLAQKLLDKAVTQAETALATLNIKADDVDALKADAERFTEAMDGNVGREHWHLDDSLITPSTLGLSILLGKISKLKDAQTDLLLPVHETVDKENEIRDLHDRIKGVKSASLFDALPPEFTELETVATINRKAIAAAIGDPESDAAVDLMDESGQVVARLAAAGYHVRIR